MNRAASSIGVRVEIHDENVGWISTQIFQKDQIVRVRGIVMNRREECKRRSLCLIAQLVQCFRIQ
jgi:hypothetical protein